MSFPTTRRSLIARCLTGDEAAWDEFFRAYRDPSLGFLISLGLTKVAAEDVLQEVLLKAWSRGLGFDPEAGGRFRSFLIEVLRNQLRDLWKYENRQKRAVVSTVAGDAPVSAEEPDLGTVLEQEADPNVRHYWQTRKVIREALQSRLLPPLSEAQFEAYLDWFWHGDEKGETEVLIAGRQGMTVKQLRYAREKARARLEGWR